jgi:cell division protein FtsB
MGKQKVLFIVAALGCCVYFAYHLTHGRRGLSVYFDLKNALVLSAQRLDHVHENQARWQKSVNGIKAPTINQDLLDERVRWVLNYGHDQDRIILLTDDE